MPNKFLPPQTTSDVREASIPLKGEILYDTDENKLYYGDGVTQGGFDLKGDKGDTGNGVDWGNISGNIADQTDLQQALNNLSVSPDQILPSQTGNTGKVLGTINENLIWLPPVSTSGVFTTDSLFTWEQKTENFTAQNGYGYFVTSLSNILVTLPSNPSIGHTFQVINLVASVGFSGLINGVPSPGTNPYPGVVTTAKIIRFYYVNNVFGWYCDTDLVNIYIGAPDPFFNNVVLWLRGDGENNSTNIIDSCPTPKTITRVGNPVISTAQSKYGGSSILGNGGYLTINSNNDINFGADDFTIELWFYPISNTNYSAIVTGDGRDYPWVFTWAALANSNRPIWSFGTSSAWFVNGLSYLSSPPTKWTHYAVSRQGNVFRAFEDGVLIASQTASGTIGNSDNISVFANDGLVVNGYINSLRITRGVARYTANFNPETDTYLAPTTDPYINNVVLHLKGDGENNSTSIIDSSPNSKTITRVGDTKISTTQSKYGGSSIYFDGNGDYLQVSQNIADFNLPENFTVETWVYLTALAPSNGGAYGVCLLATYNIGYPSGWQLRINGNATGFDTVNIYTGSTDLNFSYAFSLNTWYHVAMSRTGSLLKVFVNGVQIGSVTNTNPFSGNNTLRIGRLQDTIFYFDITGYIDAPRITKGIARYTANFNPETDTFLY